MLKPGTSVWNDGFGHGIVVRPYLPDKMTVDFYKHGQKLTLASSLSVEWPTVHIQRAGADKAWNFACAELGYVKPFALLSVIALI